MFLEKLHEYMGIVCDLPHPGSGRFELCDSRTGKASAAAADEMEKTFSHLIHRVSASNVSTAYETVEKHMVDLSSFVNQWLAYQTL
jgi:hypothetical protein